MATRTQLGAAVFDLAHLLERAEHRRRLARVDERHRVRRALPRSTTCTRSWEGHATVCTESNIGRSSTAARAAAAGLRVLRRLLRRRLERVRALRRVRCFRRGSVRVALLRQLEPADEAHEPHVHDAEARRVHVQPPCGIRRSITSMPISWSSSTGSSASTTAISSRKPRRRKCALHAAAKVRDAGGLLAICGSCWSSSAPRRRRTATRRPTSLRATAPTIVTRRAKTASGRLTLAISA